MTFYSFIKGFEFITGSSVVIHDHNFKQFVMVERANPGSGEHDVREFLQFFFNDYFKDNTEIELLSNVNLTFSINKVNYFLKFKDSFIKTIKNISFGNMHYLS